MSSESSGETEVSMFKPSGQPESDDSDNENDEGVHNEKQEAGKNDGNDDALDGDEDASPPPIFTKITPTTRMTDKLQYL